MSAAALPPAANMATAREENELKQEGAIEASRDPGSSVTAEDAEKKLVEESRNAGVTAFTFDPDASPEEKRAQAKAVRQPRCLTQDASPRCLHSRRLLYCPCFHDLGGLTISQ